MPRSQWEAGRWCPWQGACSRGAWSVDGCRRHDHPLLLRQFREVECSVQITQADRSGRGQSCFPAGEGIADWRPAAAVRLERPCLRHSGSALLWACWLCRARGAKCLQPEDPQSSRVGQGTTTEILPTAQFAFWSPGPPSPLEGILSE